MTPAFGARQAGDGRVSFCVWAPSARSVALSVRGAVVELALAEEGRYEGVAAAGHGDDYWYVVDGVALPDPCSRWQPRGLRGPSRVFDPASGTNFVDLPPTYGGDLQKFVIYELHVGTFSDAGTFTGAIPYLRELARLGVSAIEIMPVAEFPGARGWGYDGVYISAAQSSYGGPQGLLALVQAAHDAGLAVILDAVYNHVGASGAQALEAFGPYFTARDETPWGKAIDYECRPVREWAAQSAEGWIRDFRIDGLRLDAVHAIRDASPEHIVAEIARRAHALGAFVIAELGLDDPREFGAPACDAAWRDQFHHALHVLLTGERDGYYEPFGRVSQLAEAIAVSQPQRIVGYAQNHDQVGNRAFGDRLPGPVRPLAALCTLLSPFVPLLFMGEEYGEQAPFQFFSDHIDPEIAEATRTGRRKEFEQFTRFGEEEIPDPQDPATFERSKLTRERDPALADLYQQLLRVRRELPPGAADVIECDEQSRVLRVRRGAFELACNFGSRPARVSCDGESLLIATSEGTRIDAGALTLAPVSGALIR